MSANVISVTYYESGQRTVTVFCDPCHKVHEIDWPIGTLTLVGDLPCGADGSGVEIPAWCFGHRTGYRKYPQRPHSVVESESSSASGLADSINDNAIDNPALNWME